ncbi:phosphatase PAP2 family protein [Acaryochloris marina]|nr:phosphatidic acid phosphatase [Acaryochloris marina]
MTAYPPVRDFAERLNQANEIRDLTRDDASNDFSTEQPPTNDDEARFKQLGLPGFASFTKALGHQDNGLVQEQSFNSLLTAIQEGTQIAFEGVQLGGGIRKLANPLNAFSFQLIGNDSHGARMAAAPSFSSRNSAVDLVERYWMALCRDIPFDQYFLSPLIADACEDLNNLGFEQEFGFTCTPQTIFRGPYTGCDIGPHVSQFLLQDFDFGNQPIRQLQRYPQEGLDYLTDFDGWFQVNNGNIDPTGTDFLVGERRIITLRDAGQWVHIDFPYQSALWSTIILLGLGAEISEASPYANGDIRSSEPFGSLGGPDVTIQPALAAVYALKHAWFQKWCVHRRLRPEVYAQRLELFRRGLLEPTASDPLNNGLFNQLFGAGADVWRQTQVLERILEHNKMQNQVNFRTDPEGTWLLPIAFPEGSPTHPAYPGGHSAFVAAAATTAKALFQDAPFPNPVIPTSNGQGLVPYTGPALTIHGELNKLIANITLFRDGAGMHWRTDGTASGINTPPDRMGVGIPTGGNLLGEMLAVSMLRDIKRTYREELGLFKFQGLDGGPIEI